MPTPPPSITQLRERALRLLKMADEFHDLGPLLRKQAADLTAEADALGREELSPMAEFRFYCLDDQDHIVLGGDLDVLDLGAAVQDAHRACRDHPHFPSSRIEVWQGATRLYTSRE
jgi:hypothetical protein